MGWVKHLWGAVAGFALALFLLRRKREPTLSQSAVDLAKQDKEIADKEAVQNNKAAQDWAARHIDQAEKEAADEVERASRTLDLGDFIARKNRDSSRDR